MAQAELVLDSGWPPLALLGSVGEWGDEGTNPNEERRFIVNRIHSTAVTYEPLPLFGAGGFPGNEETG